MNHWFRDIIEIAAIVQVGQVSFGGGEDAFWSFFKILIESEMVILDGVL